MTVLTDRITSVKMNVKGVEKFGRDGRRYDDDRTEND